MNRSIKFTLAAAMAVAGACALVACGDDSGSSVTKKVSDVPEYSKLPKCELKNDAQKAVLDTSDVIYVCKDKNWEILDTNFVANDSAETLDDIPNCANKQEGNSYYIEESGVNYICENERWEIVIAKDDSKSSASTAKSSASTAKSSASKGKSSSSAIPGSDPESTGNKDGKSSASTAKSSASTAKSSASTAKSSASKGKSSSSVSKDNVKSSSSSVSPASDASGSESDKNGLPNCTPTNEGDVYFVESESKNLICKDRSWVEASVCEGVAYDPEKKKCVNGLVREIKEGFDTLYVAKYKLTYATTVTYYYTDADTAYMSKQVAFERWEGCQSNSSAYFVSNYASYSSYDAAVSGKCSNGDEFCKAEAGIYYLAVNDETYEFNEACGSPISEEHLLITNLKAGYNSQFTYDKFVKAIAATRCGEGSYYPADQFCYNGEILDKCDGSAYDPKTQFCFRQTGRDDKIGKLCGGEEYDLTEYFCDDEKKYLRSDYCGDKVEYPVADYICAYRNGLGTVGFSRDDYVPCMDDEYESDAAKKDEQFCFNGKAYDYEWTTKCEVDGEVKAVAIDTIQFCFEGRAYKKSEYEACKNSEGVVVATANITKEFCFEGQAYKTDDYEVCQRNHEGVVQVIAESSSTFCYDGQVYDINDYEPCRDENGVAKAYADRESEFCFKDKVYDKDKYVMCMNDKYEVTAVAEKGKTTCYEGEAYPNDVITACKDTEGKVDAECLKN